ncbi:thiamine phosphate synthase [Agrobacterium vitis]|uniref:Thiamine-phosphate synthase n=1 Tax=Agrobacterium vitis TaxID=373 RepID=A0AAE5AW87_AGRVI|nr:thiamine phosphate synthase [Agrobacterium vitis]MCF1500093.1 thiamine phosphate synthase [Allorhizobium sp. Av2]MCM2441846.1 thiamine phosphate synthase [Agrobacterium vitis]MUZ59093.1 thiamine phosphate synthase [Agrobacterium vitis]MVA68554.1 thiamine phosphate synthase [Agrobacterium vitis]MVA88540.1 thiamine phosphate synthase [Agrobacterium vitis]
MKLDPFYLIVDSANWIERLIPLGVKLVQLRMKDIAESNLRSHIRAAKAVCHAHDCQLIINDYWQVALDEGCDFIHLGQEDLAEADVSAIRATHARLGVSTHDEEELKMALAAKPDYVALGPIWPTVLKQMKWAPQGLPKLSTWKATIGDIPLVAIGGVTGERLDDVFSHGADSAAVVTDITRHENPEKRTHEWLEKTAKWRRT